MDRARLKPILSLGLPIIGGMVSQNVLNLVDTAMVGTLGNAALAAVGVGSFANFMATSFITGLSSGVQAMAARRKGEGRDSETALPLNAGLLLAAGLGIPGSIALVVLTPSFFPFLNDDPAVVADGVPYLQARLFAVVAMGMNFSFRGYWNGVSLSRLYLKTLLLMHSANILLNWVLIFGKLGAPAFGAEGAGMASALATYLGTGYYFYLGLRHARPAGFMRGTPSLETFGTILRLSVPTGVQQLFFSGGFTALFWIIGNVGTAQTAAAQVLIQLTLVAILPGLGLGLAAASLVGQALGRGDPGDAKRWAWDVVKVAAVVMGTLGLPMLLAPELLLSGFIHDPATAALAVGPLRVVGASMVLEAAGMVLLQALLGAGAARQVMVVSIAFQWGLFLPAAYLVGPVLGYGLLGIWLVQVGYRLVQTVVLVVLWERGRWAQIRV